MLRFLTVTSALALTCAMAPAQTIYYVDGSCGNDAWTGLSPDCLAPDGPKATIQTAIDAAVNRDVVEVADGTYTGPLNKNLDYGGKAITVRSAGGSANCIIDCENDGRGFYFHQGETTTAVLDGFTITNGREGTGLGGGILIEGIVGSSTNPTIRNCAITHCQAISGGGIAFRNSDAATMINCVIASNFATSAGGGVLFAGSQDSILANCLIVQNTALREGGGVYTESASPIITSCTI